jgi:hypothetical protein
MSASFKLHPELFGKIVSLSIRNESKSDKFELSVPHSSLPGQLVLP